ncbi:ATPase, partial [mine drainage metagenome]
MNRKEDFKIAIAERLTEGYPVVIDRRIEVPIAVEVIVSLVGPRRAGKTFLMYCTIDRLLKQNIVPSSNILYINFEHERL